MRYEVRQKSGAIVTMSCVGVVLPRRAAADEWNKQTVVTFSQAVAVPGRVLPAGTYVLQMADSQSDRHVVRCSISAAGYSRCS
jgi:hypothetical protein